MKHVRTKSDIDFILKVMSVFKGFQYKGKKYLSYIESRSRGDEFLIRDNIVKPFFTDVLGYDKQKDFVPEEKIETGKPDTQIVDKLGNPIIVVETLSSGSDKRQFDEHRKRLFDYTDELGSKIAVLSDGIVFNAYWNRGRGKAKDRLVLLRFDEIYKKFVLNGLDGLDLYDWERLLMLKYLTKELQIIDPEELYKEPELDISEERHFSNFLEQMISSMEQIKTDVKNQFEIHQTVNTEYRKLKEVREQSGRPIYASESKKFTVSKKCIQSFKKWHDISSTNRDPEVFQLETMYIFFNRILLLRICEDKGIIKKRKISNGGIKDWMTFKGFTHFSEVNYNELIKEAYKMMEKTYPHLFREDIFDWYMPNNEILLNVLFIFNPYNFKSVDRDILGKLYEKYIPREERKKLGQFYTPEEVVNYILDAVGYREDADIEGKKLLDPACGSGGFLVRAANILIQRFKSRGFDAETILNKVQDNIYGFEINPFACHLTEINLLFQVIDLIKEAKKKNPEFEMYKFNIFETDSLRIPKKEKPKLFKEYNSEWFEDAETVRQIKIKEGKFKDGFDFVVGNPPYVRADSGDVFLKIRKEIEKQDFFNTLYEKWDIYIPFIELGTKLLKGETGKLGFIVSDAFETTKYAHLSRELLCKEYSIKQVVFASDIDLFEAAIHNCIFVVENKSPTTSNRVQRRLLYDKKFTKFSELSLLPQLEYGEKVFRADYEPFLYFEETVPLGDICYTSYGLRPNSDEKKYKGEFTKDDVISETKDFIHTKSYLEGKDIGRYVIKRVRYLEYGSERVPAKIARPTFPELYQYPKLMKGVTTWTIYDEKCLFCNHSIIVCVPYFRFEKLHNRSLNKEREKILKNSKFSSGFNLKYLLAILNSKLASNFFSKIRRSKISLYPIDIDQLPIKKASRMIQQQFADLVDQILEINETLPTLEEKITNIQKFLKDFDVPFGDLADISGIRLELKERIGKPTIKREGLKVYLDHKSYIECVNGALAEYIELYLISLIDNLRGKTKPELVKLIKIPKSLTHVKVVLGKRKELLKEIDNLTHRQDEIDKEIDKRVYTLYGLNEKEIKIVEKTIT